MTRMRSTTYPPRAQSQQPPRQILGALAEMETETILPHSSQPVSEEPVRMSPPPVKEILLRPVPFQVRNSDPTLQEFLIF